LVNLVYLLLLKHNPNVHLRTIKLSLLLFLAICPGLNSTAQQTDTLLQLLKKENLSDTTLINTNNIISRNLAFVDPIRSLNYAQQALELALKIKYKKGTADAYRNLGSVYSYFGSFYLTVDNLQKSQSLYEELKDSSGIANCYMSLGHAYRKLNNISKEIYYHKQSFEIHSRLGNPERIGVAAHNLGESYFNNHELQKATDLTLVAIRINDSIKNIQVLSSCYKVMGKILLAEKKPDDAAVYLNKILVIHDSLKENSQKIATIEAYINMAAVYKQKGITEKEIYYLHEATEYVKENQLGAYIKNIYLELISLYLKRNQKQEAIEHVNEYKSLSETLALQESEDKNKLVAGFTKLYEVEKENNLLEIENHYQEERVKQKNNIIILVISIALIIAILLLLLYRIVKQLKSSNRELVAKREIIEKQNEDLAVLNHTKDKFFGIVSHDLKAPLNSVLSFADLLIGSVDTLSKEQLLELSRELKLSIESSRKLTNDLITWSHLQMKEQTVTPETFSAVEITDEVFDIYGETARKKNISLKKQHNGNLIIYADRNHYSFVIRNIINNAIKFTANGGSITVTGTQGADTVTISIADTGIGMNEQMQQSLFHLKTNMSKPGTDGETGTGLGLILLYEFVKLNAGSIDVQSTVGKGTVFSVTMPSSQAGKKA